MLQLVINGQRLKLKTSHCNPLAELVKRIPIEELNIISTQTKIDWIFIMKDLFLEAGVNNPTLERLWGYVRWLKSFKQKKELDLEVEKIYYNFILNAEGLNEHLQMGGGTVGSIESNTG